MTFYGIRHVEKDICLKLAAKALYRMSLNREYVKITCTESGQKSLKVADWPVKVFLASFFTFRNFLLVLFCDRSLLRVVVEFR